MYELMQVAENSYYIQSPAKIGIVKLNDKDVCLIDSGNDKDAGRKIRQILDANGWHLTAIYNTHANADHIGGNRYLQGQTGCKIYVPGIDCEFTRHPILEPGFLYGGYPPKDIRHKFLMVPSAAKTSVMLIDPDKYLYDGKIIRDEGCRIGYAGQFTVRDKAQDMTVFQYLSERFLKNQQAITDVCEEMAVAESVDELFEKYQQLLDIHDIGGGGADILPADQIAEDLDLARGDAQMFHICFSFHL